MHVHTITAAEGNTALHYAARAGHVECFACLLRHGASLEIPNLHQETPQDISRQYGKHKAIATAGKRKLCNSYIIMTNIFNSCIGFCCAVSMLVQCSLCLTEEVHKQHAAETLPSPMEQKIVQRSKSLFIHPLPMLKTRFVVFSLAPYKYMLTLKRLLNQMCHLYIIAFIKV